MRKFLTWLGYSLCAAGMVAAIAGAAQTRRLIFLSTQLRPIEEAQKMRNVILKDFPRDVDYVPEHPQLFPVLIKEAVQEGTHTIDVVGALHGELQPLARGGALAPLDGLARKLTDRGIPDALLTLGRFRRHPLGDHRGDGLKSKTMVGALADRLADEDRGPVLSLATPSRRAARFTLFPSAV
jgi:multiple sugar transport system substrate-binding protein